MIDNYWGFEEKENLLNKTENIFNIMYKQCDYLNKHSSGVVIGCFDEIKNKSGIYTFASGIGKITKEYATKINDKTFESCKNNDLIDINSMYECKTYGFEIYNDYYKYRIFELKIPPLYPVEIKIESDIFENIKNKITGNTIIDLNLNTIVIDNEYIFCDILKLILQDKKVRFVIDELIKKADNIDNRNFFEKIILCEGYKEEIILNAIAKHMKKKVVVKVLQGKDNLSKMVKILNKKKPNSKILIVVDSDGDEEYTKKCLIEQLGDESYSLCIVNDTIEDWFSLESDKFNKMNLIGNVNEYITGMNFEKLCEEHKSLRILIEFLEE